MNPYHLWLGIAPEEQPPNHYRLLGVRLFEDNGNVLNMACNRQMAHVQSFLHGPHAAISQQLMREISAAHACLLHPEWKAAYDRQLTQAMSAASPQWRPIAVQNPTPMPGPILPAAGGPTAPDEEPEEQDDAWDAAEEEITGRRRGRRRRRQSDGNLALLGIAAVVVVGAVGAVIWRSLPAEHAATRAKPPAAVHADHDAPHAAARKAGSSAIARATHTPDGTHSARSAADPMDSQDQPAAGGDPNMPLAGTEPRNPPATGDGMAGRPKVAPAFAGRLDPRLNPDLATILDPAGGSTNGAGGPASGTGGSTGGAGGSWEDGRPFNPKLGAFDRITLGPGLFLSEAAVDLKPEQVATMVPGDADIFTRTAGKGIVTGAFSSLRGELDGPAVELSFGKAPSQFGAYEAGQRDGAFRIWGQNQKRLLYSQYSKGVKNGITCVFRGGLPRYVEVSSPRGAQQEFLIRFSASHKATVTPKRDFSPQDLAEHSEARARLALLEASLAKHELIYKQQFDAWWEGIKQQRASAPGKGPAHGPARDAKNSAIFSNLLRDGE